ncbi:small integral membrane protein 40 [Pelodytes ibericus]
MESSSSDTEDPSSPLLAQTPPADEGVFEEDDSFAVLARVTTPPDSTPWEQRSTLMKIVYFADRIFLGFLAIFLLVLIGEVTYILYNIVPWPAISRGLRDWLLTQEDKEEELDL